MHEAENQYVSSTGMCVLILDKAAGKVSMKKLGFGFMRLPVLDENDRSTVDVRAVEKMVDLFMERGFT